MMKWGYQKELDIIYEYCEDQSDDHLLQYISISPAKYDRRLGFNQRKSNSNGHSLAKTI
jgi:hypothetical protein